MEGFKFCVTRDTESPERANSTDAGVDFFIPYDYNNGVTKMLDPGETVVIPTGIHVRLNPYTALIFADKSGVASKCGLILGAKVIDEGYQGEIFINMWNISNHPQKIIPGNKIAQGIIHNVCYETPVKMNSIEELYPTKSERGTGATGSSGLTKQGDAEI